MGELLPLSPYPPHDLQHYIVSKYIVSKIEYILSKIARCFVSFKDTEGSQL